MLLNGIFEAGILHCRAERVRNPVECDILAAQWSGFLVSGTNLVGYIHWQNNFMLLKRGFKIMDLHGVFKVHALTLYIHYFVISHLIIKRMHQSCALCPLKTIIEHCLCKHSLSHYHMTGVHRSCELLGSHKIWFAKSLIFSWSVRRSSEMHSAFGCKSNEADWAHRHTLLN